MIRVNHASPKLVLALHSRVLFGLIALGSLLSRVFGLDDYLEYDRSKIIAGQIWRLASGHLAHWTSSHLVWDLGAFLILSVLILGRRNLRSSYATIVGASACVITLFQLIASPRLAFYRGLSGIDSALFMFLAADIVREAFEQSDRPQMIVAAICAIGFVAKIMAEASGSGPLFATGMGQGVSTTISAHVLGAIVGVGSVLARHRFGSPRTPDHRLTET